MRECFFLSTYVNFNFLHFNGSLLQSRFGILAFLEGSAVRVLVRGGVNLGFIKFEDLCYLYQLIIFLVLFEFFRGGDE